MNTKNLTLPPNEKLGLLSNLSTMVNAGITLAEAVESLAEDSTGNLKTLLEGVQRDVTQGRPLYSSLAKYPKIFDSVTVSIIKAAEESGTVHVVLKDVKNTFKKDLEFRDKIISSLMYPSIIIVVFFGVLILLLTFVIPRIATVFMRMRVELPLPTKIFIAMSNLAVNYTVPTLAVIGGVILLLIILYKKQKKLFVGIMLSLPYVSGIARQIDLTKFCRSMYLMLNSAIPLYTALQLTKTVAVKPEITSAVARAMNYVEVGKRLSDGLRGQKAIPSLMIKIIEVGEKSGSLEKSMEDLAEYFDYQVTTSLHYFVTLLEPVVLVVVGIVVGGMMMSIIAPIYNIIGQVGTL